MSKSNPKETGILWYQLSVASNNIIPHRLFISALVTPQLLGQEKLTEK